MDKQVTISIITAALTVTVIVIEQVLPLLPIKSNSTTQLIGNIAKALLGVFKK